MGLSDLLSRTKSSLANDRPATGWSPSDSLPSSSWSARKATYELPLASWSELSFEGKGEWSRGSVVITREQGRGQQEVEEVDSVVDGKEGVRMVRVELEARSNSELLLGEWGCTVVDKDHSVGLELKTTDSTPLAALLSFHLTIYLPSSLTSLNALRISCTSFRLHFDPLLAKSLSIASLHLSTSDAPIHLTLSGVGRATIRNDNRLDPEKRSAGTTEPLLSGSIEAEQLEVECTHGSVQGQFRTTRGGLRVITTNGTLSGSFEGRSSLVLRTSNDRVEGEFRALGEGGISVESQQGKVEGNFFAPKGVRVESRNAPIKAEVEVGKGAEVLLRTTGFKVDASVKIVDQAAHIEPSEHPDSQPPTYAPAPSLGAGSGRVSILAETTEAAVALVTESDSAVVLSTEVRTNGGGKVEVQHRGEEGWRGSFSLATSLTHTATLSVLPGSATTTAGGGTPEINYLTNKRNEVMGTVGVGSNSTVVRANGEIGVVVQG